MDCSLLADADGGGGPRKRGREGGWTGCGQNLGGEEDVHCGGGAGRNVDCVGHKHQRLADVHCVADAQVDRYELQPRGVERALEADSEAGDGGRVEDEVAEVGGAVGGVAEAGDVHLEREVDEHLRVVVREQVVHVDT